MMRIVVDLQGAQTASRFRGIGRYSLSLTEALVRNNRSHEILLILNSAFPEAISQIQSIFKDLLPESNILIFDVPESISWENPNNEWKRNAAELIRENFIADLEPDVVLTTSLFEGANQCNAVSSLGRVAFPAIQSVILYDLIPLLNQESYLGADWARSWYFNKLEYLKRADLLLSISDYTAIEAGNLLKPLAGNIVNISSSHTSNFSPVELDLNTKNGIMNRLGIVKPYVMYNGAFESRKNLEGLMRAFAILPANLRDSMQLVFAGKVTEIDVLVLENLAKELGISDVLLLTGYVSDEDLIALFSLCEVFVFPSIYEGFGLPALEAMACGAPTIGSNLTSVPEVIGCEDALFDPYNPEDIASKMLRVLTDADFNASLRKHALNWSSTFSWDKCAEKLVTAFESAVSGREPVPDKDWADYIVESKRRYNELVLAIAAIDREIVKPTDTELQEVACCIADNTQRAVQFNRAHPLPQTLTWRIEGPFDSSYSLALVNRECARALNRLGHNVVLHSTEGYGDFDPNSDFLKANPDLEEMHERSFDPAYFSPDITSRNLYPPRVADMSCRLNFLHAYGWEETGFPAEWVDDFNSYLQGITVMSKHVEKLLIDAGVKVPIAVSGIGVDHWLRIEPDSDFKLTAKKFRFLHVSSCFPRKGVDVLLRAYGMAFRKADDVTLVIKTFQNPHNEIEKWLADARNDDPEFPDVLVLEEDLTDGQLKALYEKCDVLMAPSRAEGFGLPLAEAMVSGIPVITTGWSGQLDFCNEETSWLVDYKFQPAETHFKLFDSYWAEPQEQDLASKMKCVYETPLGEREKRATNGRNLLMNQFKWKDAVERQIDHARAVVEFPLISDPRIGWVSTWNTPCGIAAYSKHLVEAMPANATIFASHSQSIVADDEINVHRCWHPEEDGSLGSLDQELNNKEIDVLIIQFQYAFFNFDALSRFINKQIDSGRVVLLFLHATLDSDKSPHKKMTDLIPSFSRCQRVFVHSCSDLNRLKDMGLTANVSVFPHGIVDFQDHERSPLLGREFRLASYGFFLPHKGLLELIDAILLVKKSGYVIKLTMVNSIYPAEVSRELVKRAKEKITLLGLDNQISLITDFLSDEACLSKLAENDLVIFPYQETGESSSAAVRYGIASGVPVAVTPIAIFEDVLPAVYQLPGQTPELIAKGIEEILSEISSDSDIARAKVSVSACWRDAHNYEKLGKRLYNIISALAGKSAPKILSDREKS